MLLNRLRNSSELLQCNIMKTFMYSWTQILYRHTPRPVLWSDEGFTNIDLSHKQLSQLSIRLNKNGKTKKNLIQERMYKVNRQKHKTHFAHNNISESKLSFDKD
jgi:hypothetical protein